MSQKSQKKNKFLSLNSKINLVKNTCDNIFVLYPNDVFNICDIMEKDSDDIISLYLEPIINNMFPMFITSRNNGKCIFYNKVTQKCTLKEKPLACRIYPVTRFYHNNCFKYVLLKDQKGYKEITLKELLDNTKINESNEEVMLFYSFINRAVNCNIPKILYGKNAKQKGKFYTTLLEILYGNYKHNSKNYNLKERYDIAINYIKGGI